MKKSGVIFLVFLICAICLGAREKSDVSKRVFTKAKKYYAAEEYDSVIKIIRGYLKKHGKDMDTEHLVPLLLEALIRKENIPYFEKLSRIYKRKFPNSRFIPRLLYLEGVLKAKQRDYDAAVSNFAESSRKGVSHELDSLIVLNVEKICEKIYKEWDFRRLARHTNSYPQKIKEVVAFYNIRRNYDIGKEEKAESMAEKYRETHPESPYSVKAKRFKRKTHRGMKGLLRIGLLVPLTGDNADIGKYVMQGVKLAVEQYNKSHESNVELVIMDTKGDMIVTAEKIHDIINKHGISVIIGPVLSSNAIVAASAVMNNPDVTMITPTATDNGIASLGKNIFQMNVTLSSLARKIARYAVEYLNIREFAILAPINEYGKILASDFKEEILRLECTVVAEEYFDENASDFRLQFESLRKKFTQKRWAKLGMGEIIIDSMENMTFLNRKRIGSYLEDSTIEIGGFFIPAEAQNVVKIAHQVYFHQIQTQLLGATGWHNSATILGGGRYVENAILSTSFETDANNKQWISFSSEYKNMFRERPNRIASPLGYDAANIVLNAIEENKDAELIADFIGSVRDYHGISGIISLNNREGMNAEAAILKISNRKFIRIQ